MGKVTGVISTGVVATLIIIGVNVDSVSANNKFGDVTNLDVYSSEVDYLTERNIISGFTDGNFKPNDKVTRSQASKIIIGAVDDLGVKFPKKGKQEMVNFSDVKSTQWYYYPVSTMYVNNIISGYTDGKFKPNLSVTNAQVSKMLTQAFGMEKEKTEVPYTDITKTVWYAPHVSSLYATGVYTRGFDNKFNPDKEVTRAELSVYVAKAMKWKDNQMKNPQKNKEVAIQELTDWGNDEEYPKSYKMIKKGLENVDGTIHFDTSEIEYLIVEDLIKEVMRQDANRYHVKNWVSYGSGKIEMKYEHTREEIKHRNVQVNKKADEILKEIIKPTFTDYDKVKAVHDYVVLNTSYDLENFKKGKNHNDTFTAYGTLITGVAVCDGYTRATNLLLNKLGIESVYVEGYVNGGALHSWNMVKLDGKYYHMDVTWDDPTPNDKGLVQYKYFLVNSSQLAKDHKWEQGSYSVANSTLRGKR